MAIEIAGYLGLARNQEMKKAVVSSVPLLDPVRKVIKKDDYSGLEFVVFRFESNDFAWEAFENFKIIGPEFVSKAKVWVQKLIEAEAIEPSDMKEFQEFQKSLEIITKALQVFGPLDIIKSGDDLLPRQYE